MESSDGLSQFNRHVHPALLAEVRSWRDHDGLHALHDALVAHAEPKSFLDACAEAMVARHMLAASCDLRFEVPTPAGKQCDFEVVRGDTRFYLHVKRLETDRPRARRLSISPRLRYLERIERPYVVCVRWHDGVGDEAMEQLVREAVAFIKTARVGDELTVRTDGGAEIGGVQVVAPWDGNHVRLTIGLPEGFIDDVPRMRRLMSRAYQQFMPRAVNVILLCSTHDEDAADTETALLGAHIERWDRHPPVGHRIAHGRDADGFWHNSRHEESHAAGWFRFAPRDDTFVGRLWLRDGNGIDSNVLALIEELFPLSPSASQPLSP